MPELNGCEEVYGSRTLTNGNIEWFGTHTGRHLYSPKEADVNESKKKLKTAPKANKKERF